ncbi:hypothetical protein BO71DRAFT_425642 [Aspergillus ellipticus CBS 707.79]|uniref:TPR-like protein n=1 Tax=Aspergillus ellipticus CBS 707.79 TaxID=1448320 RepID=A0A319DN32_9EURO|nr:hypothetical protein BO71DRAFT_425642 [Aspergillus ellipticus CBS 707.79]
MPLINLGVTSYWVEGRLDEAAATFQQALTDREKEYGVNDTTSFATGKLLLGYGNVKWDQGRFDERFALHQRCLQQYKATTGNNHHRTADACVKVSGHHLRLRQHESALLLLCHATKIYDEQPHFISERARASDKRGTLYKVLGRMPEASKDFEIAIELYYKLNPDDTRTFPELGPDDFDKKIMFWSR